MKMQTQNNQDNFERNITLPDFNICNKATVMKTVQYDHKDRQISHVYRMGSPGVDHTHGQLDFNTDTKVIQ